MTEDSVEARRAYIQSVKDSFHQESQRGGRNTAGSIGEEEDALVGSGTMFKVRLLISAFLLAAFIFCDRTGERIASYTTEEVYARLEENYDYTKFNKYVMMSSDAFHKEVEDEPSGIK